MLECQVIHCCELLPATLLCGRGISVSFLSYKYLFGNSQCEQIIVHPLQKKKKKKKAINKDRVLSQDLAGLKTREFIHEHISGYTSKQVLHLQSNAIDS